MAKRYAQGGSVKGAHGIDKVPAKLTAGEYVLPTKTVQAMGAPALDNLVEQTNGQPPGGQPVEDATPRQGILSKARGVSGYADGGLVLPDNLQPKNLNTDPVPGAQLLARLSTPGFESAPGSSLPPDSSAAPAAPVQPIRAGINTAAASPPVNNSTPNPGPAATPAPKGIIAAAPGQGLGINQPVTVTKEANGERLVSNTGGKVVIPSMNEINNFDTGGGSYNQTHYGVQFTPATQRFFDKPAPTPAEAEQQRVQSLLQIQNAQNDRNLAKARELADSTGNTHAKIGILSAAAGNLRSSDILADQAGLQNAETNRYGITARAGLESAQARETTLKGNEQQQMLDLQKQIEDPNLTEADRGRALQAYYRRSGKGPFQFGVNPMTQETYAGNSLTGEIKTPGSSSPSSGPVEGATATSNGHPMVFRNGQWQPAAAK